MNIRASNKWYHGSPEQIAFLQKGSTITQNKHLAQIFSHKPTIVNISNFGKIKHNGRRAGFLYEIDEFVKSDDVYPHPRSTMPKGSEWMVNRELKVKFVAETRPLSEELLSSFQVYFYRLYSKMIILWRRIAINRRQDRG